MNSCQPDRSLEGGGPSDLPSAYRYTSKLSRSMKLKNFQLDELRHSCQAWRARFEADYRRFARHRGFKTFNDCAYHRRGFVECWAEPGFHRFWQVWNPGIAYFVYQAYMKLGGAKMWVVPTLLSFVICGVIHTIIVVPFMGKWPFSLIVAFTFFAVLTVLSRKLSGVLRQYRWPGIINTAVNVGLVIAGFDVGFRVDRLFG